MGRWLLSVGILLAALAQAATGAINVQLNQEDIRRATELARFPNSDADRVLFHRRYTMVVDGPVVEYFAVEKIEVVTPFRRLELIAEEHARINDLFARGGLKDAEAALQPWRELVTIVAHLRFDLTKVILNVPEADVVLEGPTPVLPISVNSTGIYGTDGNRTWLVGSQAEALFDVRAVGQAMRPVVVRWNGKELARVTANFAAME